MDNLGIPIPPFVLRRKLVVAEAQNERGQLHIVVRGEDVDGTPVSFLRSVKCTNNRRHVRSEPFSIGFRGDPEAGMEVKLELEFMGHYGEPNLEITYNVGEEGGNEAVYSLEYSTVTRKWSISS